MRRAKLFPAEKQVTIFRSKRWGLAQTAQIGFDPVVTGGLAMGKYLVPGTPLGAASTRGKKSGRS
jgi:predicted dinucleotide-binding enzyme